MRSRPKQALQEKIERELNVRGRAKSHEIGFLVEFYERVQNKTLEEHINDVQHVITYSDDGDAVDAAQNALRVYRAAAGLVRAAQHYHRPLPSSMHDLNKDAQEEIAFFERDLILAAEQEQHRSYREKLFDISGCGFEYFCTILQIRYEQMQNELVTNRLAQYQTASNPFTNGRQIMLETFLKSLAHEHAALHKFSEDRRARLTALNLNEDWDAPLHAFAEEKCQLEDELILYESAARVDPESCRARDETQKEIQRVIREARAYLDRHQIPPEWITSIRKLERMIAEKQRNIEQLRVRYLSLIDSEQREFADEMMQSYFALN